MPKGTPASTRVASDIVAAAASAAAAEHRTVTEQINYWARIGMQVERSGSAASRRALAVAAGTAQFSTGAGHERDTAHALIDARIAGRVANQRFGHDARIAGQTTVSIDDDGNLVTIAPQPSTRPMP